MTVLLAVLLSGHLSAANLTGRVSDSETGTVIRDVNIRILETGQVTSTSKKGTYEFKRLAEGVYHLIATHVNYETSDTITVAVPGGSAPDISIDPRPWVLNEVVVTGTRSPHLLKNVPVQTEVITSRDFQRTGATTVDEALASSIGLTINENLSGQGATIRGIEGDRVLVLVDGERAVGRVRGSIDLSQISLSNVEKIEVIKGSGSMLYGSDAMGGVINIITKKPKYRSLSSNLYADFGTHTSYNPGLELEYGNDDVALNFGARLFSTGGFDLDKSTRHTNGQEEIDRWNFNSKVRMGLSDRWSLTSSGRIMRENRKWVVEESIPLNSRGDTLTKAWDDDEINQRYEASVRADYLSGDSYHMYLRLFGTYYNHTWNKFDTAGIWVDTSETKDVFWELSYDANYLMGETHQITFGLNYNYMDLESTELVSDARADQAGAAYLQYEYGFNGIVILPGVRYEYHNSFGSHLNPSFNMMYRLVESLRLRGFVGYGFRAPSIKQQYFVFDHTAAGYIVYGGNVSVENGQELLALKEETSINSSISAEFSYGTVGLHRLTYFYNHLDDLIDFGDAIDFLPPYWRGRYVYRNIETAVTQGIEWESQLRLSPAVRLSLSYNYLYTRILASDDPTEIGGKLVNRPDHTFKFVAQSYYKKMGIGATFWGSYQSRRLWKARSNTGGNEGPPVYAPHRTLLNLNLFKRFSSNTETFLRFENLLNETDVTYGYWPGFQLFAGVKYGLSLEN